jgi:preprotein translocase subunit Sec63
MINELIGRLFKRSTKSPSAPNAQYYKILGVKPGASVAAIEEAYKAQSQRLHEDLEQFSHDQRLKARMEELIRELDEAYAVVKGKGDIVCPLSASEILGDEEDQKDE